MSQQEEKVAPPRYRSGAVARRAKMPVSTLRIWERRYEVAPSAKTDTGHRLYSEDDVRRIVLLKSLVNCGHAIGSIAKLTIDQLKEIAAQPEADQRDFSAKRTWRLVVIGSMQLHRLKGIESSPPILIAFNTIEEARCDASLEADGLLIHMASLQEESSRAILHLAKSIKAEAISVTYGFGTNLAIDALGRAGVLVHREPLGMLDFTKLVDDLFRRLNVGDSQWTRAPRRFTDLSLLEIAGLSPTISCECPRHLAELVMQLSAFETYSDECVSTSPTDAALHRYLADVANRARSMIETALERVAHTEGLSINDDALNKATEAQA
jgi:DNA-binding transcriptional MerR regulator